MADGLQPIEVPSRYEKSFVALDNISVYFMETCGKMSEKRKLQKRVIVVIRDHLYSCYEDGSITRCIRTPTIGSLLVQDSDVVVSVPGDHDIWVRMPPGIPVNALVSVLTRLYRSNTSSELPVTYIPAGGKIGDSRHPVQLVKPDRQPIYLDPMTQPEPALEKPPLPPSLMMSEADNRHRARGLLTVPFEQSALAPPPPPEEDFDEAVGVDATGSLVTSGTLIEPTVELEHQQSGTTAGVVTLSQEQLNNADGGPIKINLQIVTRDGETSAASSRVESTTPASIPAPPSRSASGYSDYRGGVASIPASSPVSLQQPSVQPSVQRSTQPSVQRSVQPSAQPSVPSAMQSAPPPSARENAPSVRDVRSVQASPMTQETQTMTEASQVSQTQAGTQVTVPNTPVERSIGTSPAVQPVHAVQVGTQMSVPSQAPVQEPSQPRSMQSLPSLHPVTPVMQPSAASQRTGEIVAKQLPTPAAETPRQAPSAHPSALGARLVGQDQWEMGPLVEMTVPTPDGSLQTVHVPEASVPNVHALVSQIHEAQENLSRKDQQLTAVLNLTQKNSLARKERAEDKMTGLVDQIRGAESELERVRAQLHDAKSRLVGEKEAHLHQLAEQAAAAQAVQAAQQAVYPVNPVNPPYQNYSPGARLSHTSPLRHSEMSRVSPVRTRREEMPMSARSSKKPQRQYSHSPLQPHDQENDWAKMSRICQDISQRIDSTKVTQSPRATEAKRHLASQFSPLPKLASVGR